jgi:hypothetical protein
MCADGSAFSYFVRTADPTKVVFFLQGGGGCFDATTCAFDSRDYKVTVAAGDDPASHPAGIFDFANPANPLAGYSFVFVPYCTGDFHLGAATRQYGPQLTIHHNGSANASTALGDLAARFPDATDVVVAGESAGSAPTPFYAGRIHDALPDAYITVLADGSGVYPDVPVVNAKLAAAWGTTPEPLSMPGLFVSAYQHDSAMVFARHDFAFDAIQQYFGGVLGFDTGNVLALIDSNEQQIEAAGVDLHSYIAPGRSHTILSKPDLYTETVEGIPLVDWIRALVERRPAADVHCADCAAG